MGKLSPLIIAVVSLIAIIYVGYSHYTTFKLEYSRLSISGVVQALSPYIILGVLLFFLTAYLLYLFKRNKSPSLPTESPTPSPQSATNPLTYAVGNVFNFMKPANPKPETLNRNSLLSAIKRV